MCIRDSYEGKFITETDPDLMKKYQDLYKKLEELDTEGKSYHDIQQQLKKIEQEISKVQADLKKVENSGIIAVSYTHIDVYKRQAEISNGVHISASNKTNI